MNGIPPNAFKSMNNHNLRTLFGHVKDFWDNKADLDKWYEGQFVPVPEKGDLVDPNKWRGVSLMDIRSKVFSGILCERAFMIVKKRRKIPIRNNSRSFLPRRILYTKNGATYKTKP